MSITNYYKIITPQSKPVSIGGSQNITGSGLYGNYTWYNKLIAGSSQRISRYREYDIMDNDIDVSRALDIIAEEMMGNCPKSEMPLEIEMVAASQEYISPQTANTIRAGLKTWCKVQDWENRLYTLGRLVIKYGDCFFLRPQKISKKYEFVHPRNVTEAIVSTTDVSDIRGWHVRVDNKEFGKNISGSMGFSGIGGADSGDHGIKPFSADDVIRFSLNGDMTDEAPFGESILRSIFRTFKQKELIEDALIIYRISRAPERRVFYIDMGKTNPMLAAKQLENMKNEIRQKKIPSASGGKAQIDSVYNPQSINEDFFFAVNGENGRGSRVEVLPGGQNLGQLEDLDYFYKKIWRGLRIPQSYMDSSSDGGAIANDGKVGIAYMQEIKFSLYIERLQKCLESTLDSEFKKFLTGCGINVDHTIFKIILPSPSNYAKSRQQSIDTDLLNNLSTADSIDYLSKQFILEKYGQLSQEEIKRNEFYLRKEMGLRNNGGAKDIPQLYRQETAEAGGFEGGLGGSMGGLDGDGENLDGEEMEGEEGLDGASSVDDGLPAQDNANSKK